MPSIWWFVAAAVVALYTRIARRRRIVLLTNPPSHEYNLKDAESPGKLLQFLTWVLEGPLGRSFLVPLLIHRAGITRIRQIRFDDPPTYYPYGEHPAQVSDAPALDLDSLLPPSSDSRTGRGFTFTSTLDYARAYRSGATTPEEVARKILDRVRATQLYAIIKWDEASVLRAAALSTLRFREGKPLGLLDGIPVVVKDELDVVGMVTHNGSIYLEETVATVNADAVQRLLDRGCILIGKTNMHEMGLGTTGFNRHFGTPRNPYHSDYHTGGSSSGTAAAVAAGFVPFGIGADGGGSIRIPAGFCGVYGLKATFGRVSHHGCPPLCWSISHVGPIGATAADLIIGYLAMAGPDNKDTCTLYQPAPFVPADVLNFAKLKGLKIGIDWRHAQHCAPETLAAFRAFVKLFSETYDAQLVDVEFPELEEARVAHNVLITSEMSETLKAHGYENFRHRMGLDVRTVLAAAATFEGTDYVTAVRYRTRAIRHIKKIFEGVDVLLSPNTANTAPFIAPQSLPLGQTDVRSTVRTMRYMFMGNLTGVPGVTFPIAYSAAEGLPIAGQFMARWWDESTLLTLAAAAERLVERTKPRIFYPMLA